MEMDGLAAFLYKLGLKAAGEYKVYYSDTIFVLLKDLEDVPSSYV